jgi:myo-inositol-1(or 4)-monophosphatase
MYTAERGHGAYLNDKRLRVAGRSSLREALIATGIPFLGREGHERFLAELAPLMAATSGVRRFGAASLDLAYVAAGRFDGFWERGLSPWDVAGGTLLVREAGGHVSDLAGRSNVLESSDILAANDSLHPVLLKLLRASERS